MTMNRVKVFAPASISNVGPGFDVLGIAIEQPGDIVIAERTPKRGLHFLLQQDSVVVPTDINNVAAHVAQLMINTLQPNFGITLTLQKLMPIGSGLGSSGASAAAAAFAVNLLLDNPLTKSDLIVFAAEGERLASGSAHADNVAPSLLGGICLIRSYHPLEVLQLPHQNQLYWIVVHPHLVIETKQARALLPTHIPIAEAISQCSHLAALVTGLQSGDSDLIASALVDHIAEPVRAPLIPGYDAVKNAALRAGALGFSISGSGPSVFAIATTIDSAKHVENAIQQAFKQHASVDSDAYCSRINNRGAVLLESS